MKQNKYDDSSFFSVYKQMVQFNELEDTITVKLKELQQGCEMTFSR